MAMTRQDFRQLAGMVVAVRDDRQPIGPDELCERFISLLQFHNGFDPETFRRNAGIPAPQRVILAEADDKMGRR